MDNGRLTNIVEALLFAAAEPLQAKAICKVVEGAKEDDITQAVAALNDRYMQADSSFRVREIAGGFQLHTLPDYADLIEALLAKTKIQRLSAAALETLAVIAYRQPVSTPELEKIRGVESSGVLRTLLERNLVAITGRSDGPGRPLLYGTTREFLYYFGLNELRELPRIEELEKLLEHQDFSRQLSIELDVDAAPKADEKAAAEETPGVAEESEPAAVEESPTATPEAEQPAAEGDITSEPAEEVPTDEPAIALAEETPAEVTVPTDEIATETVGEPEESPAVVEASVEKSEPVLESEDESLDESGDEPQVDESPEEETAPRQLVMKRTTPETAEVEDEPVRVRKAVNLSPSGESADEAPVEDASAERSRLPRETPADPKPQEPAKNEEKLAPDDEKFTMTEMDVPVPKDETDQDDNGELIKTAKDVLDTPPD